MGKFGLIKKVTIKNSTLFMPFDLDENLIVHNFLLKDELDQEIVKLLMTHEFVKKADVYKYLNQSREKTYYHVNKLIEYGVICLSDQDYKTIYLDSQKEQVINLVINKNSIEKKFENGGN